MLEISKRTVCRGEVPKGRASSFDGLRQNILHCRRQHLKASGPDVPCRSEGRDLRPVQGLAHIDIPQTRHHSLVQQQGLGALGSPSEHCRQAVAAKVGR